MQLRLEPRYSLADVLAGNCGVEDIIVPGPPGVQVLPGGHELTNSLDKAEHAWNRVLAQLPGLTLRPEVVVIDAGNRPERAGAAVLAGGRSRAAGQYDGNGRDYERLRVNKTAQRSGQIGVDHTAAEPFAKRYGCRRGPAAIGPRLPAVPRLAAAKCRRRAGRCQCKPMCRRRRAICAGSASVRRKRRAEAGGASGVKSVNNTKSGRGVTLECDGLPSLFTTHGFMEMIYRYGKRRPAAALQMKGKTQP